MPKVSLFSVSEPRAWAEINLNALRHNLKIAIERGGHPVMAVVKAGAYGHGLEEIARALAYEPGVAFLGVANVGEARRITHAGVPAPIYILGPTWAGERAEIVAHGWIPCLSTLDEARHFNALAEATGRKLTVHLAVDTGMGRGGFVAAELPAMLPALDQCTVFAEVITATGGPGRWRWRHLCNSAGLLAYPHGSCNLTRPGLMLYGISPVPDDAPLLPVMTLKARVTLVRTLPAGHGVSYGRTFITTRPTRVATLGIGYGDGYPRHLSNHGAEVMIHGHRAPVLGRITMDQTMIDVTDIPSATEGDEVEMFGPNIPVAEIAAKSGTIAWEILTRITARVTRIHHH